MIKEGVKENALRLLPARCANIGLDVETANGNGNGFYGGTALGQAWE